MNISMHIMRFGLGFFIACGVSLAAVLGINTRPVKSDVFMQNQADMSMRTADVRHIKDDSVKTLLSFITSAITPTIPNSVNDVSPTQIRQNPFAPGEGAVPVTLIGPTTAKLKIPTSITSTLSHIIGGGGGGSPFCDRHEDFNHPGHPFFGIEAHYFGGLSMARQIPSNDDQFMSRDTVQPLEHLILTECNFPSGQPLVFEITNSHGQSTHQTGVYPDNVFSYTFDLNDSIGLYTFTVSSGAIHLSKAISLTAIPYQPQIRAVEFAPNNVNRWKIVGVHLQPKEFVRLYAYDKSKSHSEFDDKLVGWFDLRARFDRSTEC